MLFIVLCNTLFVWRRFKQVKLFQLIDDIRIKGVSMLKNWNRKYFNHYIIKFIGFMSILLEIIPETRCYKF